VDLVVYLGDFIATLRSFIAVNPGSVNELMRRGFVEQVLQLYETAIPRLQENWHAVKNILKRCVCVCVCRRKNYNATMVI